MIATLEPFASPRVDSRMLREIQSDSRMASENPNMMAEWGGPGAYQYWVKQPVADRLTYFAVQQGYSDPKAIADVTDLKLADVNRSIGKLTEQGFLAVGEVTPEV